MQTCHSPTGDLAGIGKRYDPPTLQSKFLFPRTVGFGRAGARAATSKPVTVTVTQSSGEVVRAYWTDWTISTSRCAMREASTTPGNDRRLKVEKHDPYAAHNELLDHYTDKDIHNIVAYLETLK